jgi:hypothetical protein
MAEELYVFSKALILFNYFNSFYFDLQLEFNQWKRSFCASSTMKQFYTTLKLHGAEYHIHTNEPST